MLNVIQTDRRVFNQANQNAKLDRAYLDSPAAQKQDDENENIGKEQNERAQQHHRRLRFDTGLQ